MIWTLLSKKHVFFVINKMISSLVCNISPGTLAGRDRALPVPHALVPAQPFLFSQYPLENAWASTGYFVFVQKYRWNGVHYRVASEEHVVLHVIGQSSLTPLGHQ